jgi:hypothetical protein
MREEIPVCHNTPMMPTDRYRNEADGKIYRKFRCNYCLDEKNVEVKV